MTDPSQPQKSETAISATPGLPAAPLPPGAAQPATTAQGDGETYRPLSLLAMAGFGLAVVYAAGILIGSLIAFFGSRPWLLPPSTILVPFVALVLLLIARVQIKRSEGTLAGEGLTRWGLSLTVLVALGYWSYYGATYLAVSQQGEAFGKSFLDHFTRGEVEAAFLLTRKPDDRPSNPSRLRQDIEIRWNISSDAMPLGEYSRFLQNDMVRLITHAREATQIEPRGIADWEYKEGGYRLQASYRVSTPIATFEVLLTLHATDTPTQGREWQIVLEQSGLRGKEPAITPEGMAMSERASEAGRAMQQWLRHIYEGRPAEAYLFTRLPKDRATLRTTYATGLFANGIALGAQPGGTPPAAALVRALLSANGHPGRCCLLPGYQSFLDGSLVRDDEATFWTLDRKKREEIASSFKARFRDPGPQLAQMMKPEMLRIPIYRKTEGRVQIELDFQAPLMEQRSMVEGRVVVEGPDDESSRLVENWHVASVNLIRGKSVGMSMAPPPPPPPGARPPM
jgi:hypothetical protein